MAPILMNLGCERHERSSTGKVTSQEAEKVSNSGSTCIEPGTPPNACMNTEQCVANIPGEIAFKLRPSMPSAILNGALFVKLG